MAKQNKVAVNLAQDFTDAEKAQARDNIGAGTANVHIITTDYSTPTLSDSAFTELVNAVNNNEEVLMKVGQGSTVIYYKLSVVNASEYRFESYTANGLSYLSINPTTKAKTFNTVDIGLPTVFKDTIADGSASQIINIPVSIYVQPLSLNWSRTLNAYSIIDMNVNLQYRWEDQNATPEYVIQLMNGSTVLDEVLWQVPRDESTFQEPHILGYDLRLIYHNTTNSSMNLSLRIRDEGQAPTGSASIDQMYVKGMIWNS